MEYIQNVFSRLFQCMTPQDQSVDSRSQVLASILMSVSLSNKEKSLKLKHYDISRAYFQEQWRNSVTSDQSVC